MGQIREKGSFWFSTNGRAAIVLMVFTLYYLLMEHRAHLFQALPFLILLLCPLMHFFMHREHGHHHGGNSTKSNDTPEPEAVHKAYEEGLKEGRKQRQES